MRNRLTSFRRVTPVLAVAVALLILLAGSQSQAENGANGRTFEVTVTNLTRGQQFTPILVATHRAGIRLFNAGQPASAELIALAEEGNTGPLTTLLSAMPAVKEVTSSGGLLDPGQSVSVRVHAPGNFNHVSAAAMLIPTNDAFFSVMDVEGPSGQMAYTFFSPAYDAGSEVNDELCASIPGPFFTECGGPGSGGSPGQGEGFVHIHAGIHGIGSLNAAMRDWRNPVARVIIQRVH